MSIAMGFRVKLDFYSSYCTNIVLYKRLVTYYIYEFKRIKSKKKNGFM